jgi:hypothetical protein
MRPTKPAGGDTPPDFLNEQPFVEKPSDALLQMNVDMARHNLEVTLKRTKEGCFRAAKAEAAFIMMAIKEYLQDLVGLSEMDLIRGRRLSSPGNPPPTAPSVQPMTTSL